MKIRKRTLISGITVLLTYLMIIIFLFVITKGEAQKLPKQKLYQLKITRTDGSKVKGYLHSVQNDVLYLNESQYDSKPFEVKMDQVKTISVRKKGGVGRGAAVGALSGALLGYIIGYATYQKPDCLSTSIFCFDFGPGYSAISGMSIGMLIGGGIGALAGGSSKTFEINGKQESFELIKPEIAEYQVIYDPMAEVK